MKREDIFRAIRAERKRQDQLHPEFREFSPAEVAAVLSEECGEAVKELNALQWNEPGHTNEMLVTELIQTAAVVVRILEVLRFARVPEMMQKPEAVEACLHNAEEPAEEQEKTEPTERAEDREAEPKPEPEKDKKGGASKYKGFVHLRCEVCGKVHTFCSKVPLPSYKCIDCGSVTTLGEGTSAAVVCKCGKYSKYRTNIQDWSIEIPCIQCGQPNDLVYNGKRNRFEPMDYSFQQKGKKK